VNGGCLLRQSSRVLFSGLLLLSWGCVHRIHVTPAPPAVSPATIAELLQVIVPFLAMEGADHMRGISLLEWWVQDLWTAESDYINSRKTVVW